MTTKPKKDPELAALEKRIRSDLKTAKENAAHYLTTQNLNHADICKCHNGLIKMLRLEVLFGYATLLGNNAYIRQITHTVLGDNHTTWQVGIFQEVGKYTVIADERQPHVALAKALHQSGTIIPNS